MRRLLEYDAERGLRIDFVGDSDGKSFALEYIQDVEPLLERNKRMQSETIDRKCEMRHYASVPITVQYQWIRQYGVDPLLPEHSDLLERLLNSNEYRYLKTQDVII